ncbi:hypothetical protein [Hymenobacter psychrophilus]|uniref:Uncharacterized protein n=1 Tax=Hymenobacter psychrophilus TaxID=651662 RepID=A0A1H3N397_9BACT|nr:hypothetical protein [Hymenobacter psychrophilus]SDY83224.1 hypothetical protein SAMN04488069_11515 [Hymenobacter psychrophilus]
MFNFEHLDNITRQYMLIEVEQAIKASQLNFSKRFNGTGLELYPGLLREAVTNGTEATLAAALQQHQCFNTHEKRGAETRQVPENAATTFAEGEFNAFYMRGVCHRALQEGCMVQVYRAKASDMHRKGSELIEGNLENPQRVLLIIRNSLDGSQRGLGMPAGSNSGLSIRLTSTRIK